jgi:hypothetical protein
VGHAKVLQHLKQEVKQTHLSTCNHSNNDGAVNNIPS